MGRKVILVGLVLAGHAGLPASAAPEAEAYWTQSCARCHRDVVALTAPYAGRDPQEAAAELDSFLARHRAPDAALRAALIDWLLSQVSE
ncbi:hypothetical protein M4578_09255 [Salipiger sp. P9]|uniref:hypothetical protein n=1 Tax=Salipiger pentaromativorans TaxID=2943193 RepID=UPI0021574962|nr:hypothetical protein [Salipiger pentaromativorans]MCR8548014.1 hypothetical protein [Salipiger pentaromativorans]